MNFLYRYRLSATGTGTLGVGPGEVIISFGRAPRNPFFRWPFLQYVFSCFSEREEGEDSLNAALIESLRDSTCSRGSSCCLWREWS